MSGIVVYDSGCPYCVTISRIVSMSNKFDTVPYDSEEVKVFLESEFEDPGFTFYLVEDDKIYFGDRAAQRIAEKLYRSRMSGKFFLKTYPYFSKVFSVISGRANINQPVCTDERCLVNTEKGGVVNRRSSDEDEYNELLEKSVKG